MLWNGWKLNEEEQKLLEDLLRAFQLKREGKSSTYLHSLLRMEEQVEGEKLTLKMPITPLLDNSLQIVHGGMTATLLDSAMGKLVYRVIPESKIAVTAEMKINYTAPAVGSELICEATLIHRGAKTMVTEGKVFRDDGALVAHCTATFFILNKKG